jgi:hypothetical protein
MASLILSLIFFLFSKPNQVSPPVFEFFYPFVQIYSVFLTECYKLGKYERLVSDDLIFLACTFWDQKNLYQNFLHFYLETNKFALYLLSSLPLSFLTAIVGTCRRQENSRKSSHIFYDDTSCCANSYLFYGRTPFYSFPRKSTEEHHTRTCCEFHILIL